MSQTLYIVINTTFYKRTIFTLNVLSSNFEDLKPYPFGPSHFSVIYHRTLANTQSSHFSVRHHHTLA